MRALAAFVFVVVLAGCEPTSAPVSTGVAPAGARIVQPVLVVGDSMAFLAAADLQASGRYAGYDVTIDAYPGVPLAGRLDTIREAVARGTQRLVIELGTNDVVYGTPPPALDALIARAVADVAPVSCVVFVEAGLLSGPTALAAYFNGRLRHDVGVHPNEHVDGWSSTYRVHPEWSADGVHLRPPYQGAYAAGIVDTMQRSCP